MQQNCASYLAPSSAYRHIGLEADVSPPLRGLVSARLLDRARLLGAAMRVAYQVSAAMPGVLERTPLTCTRSKVVLRLPADLAPLASERISGRLKQLARLIGRDAAVKVEA